MIRTDVVNACIKLCGFRSYLEIGCKTNLTFDNVVIEHKVGVDPFQGGTIRMTSDEFFATNTEKFDVIFIDGDHRCHQVYKDIDNSIKCLNSGGIVIAHDCNPPSKEFESTQNIKCGDAWKAFVHFRQDENLDAIVCDCDYGVGLIRQQRNKAKITLDTRFDMLTWNDLVANRHQWLSLTDTEDLLRWIKNEQT